MKTHIYSLDILIRSIKIEIKFPCSISVAFKLGKEEVQTRESYKLENGEALLQQTLNLKTSLTYDIINKRYQERRGILTVHVVSSSGKNVAGILHIDVGKILNQGRRTEIDLNLERCPDKNARVRVSVWGKIVEEIEHVQDTSSANVSFYSSTANDNRQGSVQSAYKRTSIIQSQTPRPKYTSAQHYLHVGYSQSIPSNQGFRTSRVNRIQAFKPRSDYDLPLPLQTSRHQDPSHSKTISQLRIDIVQKDRRITRLQIQKTSFQKQCELLKIQITNQKSKYQAKANKESELGFENERLGKKIGILESALEAYKAKPQIRRMESFSTKFSSEELAHRSERLEELELEYRNLRVGKEDVQRLLREAKKEGRELFEKSEDLENSLTTLGKRLQLKQTFYKQQLKKYNDKILQFQSLKIELSNQNYFLKSQLDESERKLNHSVKEREKLVGDEKYRQSRRQEEIQGEIERVNGELEESNEKVGRVMRENERLEEGLRERVEEIHSMQEQINRLNSTLSEYQSVWKQRISTQLSSQKKQLEQKHRYREQELQQQLQNKVTEIQNINRMVVDKSEHVKAFNERLNQTQRKIKEKEQKVFQLTQFLEAGSKRLDVAKGNEERLGLEVNDLRLSYNKMKMELERVERERGELTEYNLQSKQHQNLLLIELKGMIKNLTEEIEFQKSTSRILQEEKMELVNQNRQLQQKSLNLNLSLTQITERQRRESEELERKRESIRQLEDENENLKTIISEQKQRIDEESTRFHTLQTKMGRVEEQSQQLTLLTEQVRRLQNITRDKQLELKGKLENETKLQVLVQKQEYQIQSLRDQLKSRVNQINNQKYISQSVRKQILLVKQQSDTIKRDNHLRLQEINRLQFQNNKLTHDIKTLTDKSQVASQDVRRYKEKCFNSFLKFFNSMCEDPSTPLNISNIDLDDLIQSAHIKLRSIKEFSDRETHNKIESLKNELQRVRTEAENTSREKQHHNNQLFNQYQSVQENYKFYKESVRLKQLEMEEDLANVTEKLREYVEELGVVVRERDQVAQRFHQEVIKSQELAVYLEQAEREIRRMVEEKDGVHQELELERSSNLNNLKRMNEEGVQQYQERQNRLREQISELQRSERERKKVVESLESQVRTHVKEIEHKNQVLRVTQKHNEDLKREILSIHQQSEMKVRKERELHEKVRSLEQSVVLTEQRQSQSTVSNQLREREIEELKHHFEKQRHQLTKKIANAEIELRNSQTNFQIRFNALTQQNIFLKERVAKYSNNIDQEYRKKDEEIVALTKEMLGKRNQINILESEFNEYKRQSENGARIVREQLQKSLYSVEMLEKKLGGMGNQVRFLEEKCSVLEGEKVKMYEELNRAKQTPSGEYQKLVAENERMRSQLSDAGNQQSLQIIELKRCKQGLLSEIQELIIRHKQKSKEVAQYYDKEIRQLTARMVSIQNDSDEKVKRAYKEKYEDRAVLEFEIQCLRQELSKYTEVRVERNAQSRNQFVGEVSEAKMKLYLSEEPLRNIEGWIPSLINLVKQYEDTIYTHQKQIKELQGELDSTNKIVQTHIRAGRAPRTSRRSSFFPQSIINETFKGTDGSSLIQKLHEILTNVQIGLRKIQDLAFDLESMTQDKCIVLTKAREVYGGLLQGKIQFSKNQLASILDYSKVEVGSFYVRVSKPN